MAVEFNVDKHLKKKIELMIKRVQDDDDQDNYLIIEGETGSGKTNASVGIAYMVAQATGREFSVNNVFFDTDKAIEFAKSNKQKIIIFDEPVFHGLKSEWRNKTQINLIKLIFTSRKKRHFVIFNLVKFSKFNDDIIEKAMALIRIYKRSESRKERRFLYIPHKNLTALLDYWRRKHIRAYNKFAVLHGTLFRYVLPEIIDKNAYENMKDEAIMTIGAVEEKESKETKLQLKITNGWKEMKKMYPQISLANYCKAMGISTGTTSKWNEKARKMGISLSESSHNVEIPPFIIDNGLSSIDSSEKEGEGANRMKDSLVESSHNQISITI